MVSEHCFETERHLKLTLAAVGCSHRIGLLVAGHAGNHLAQEDHIASSILVGPAGRTAAEAAGGLAADSRPGHSRPVAEGTGCDSEAGTAAVDRSPGCIDRSQT